MSIFEKGGPAFPTVIGDLTDPGYHQTGTNEWQFYGMTLRDFFAAKAMQGLMSREGKPDVEHETALAYRIADAMLKARGVQA